MFAPHRLQPFTSPSERLMSQSQNNKKDDFVRIDLNETQKAQVKEVTGKEANAIELSVQELEERIAPKFFVE